jgi:predicted small metal-binding protein
MIKLSCRESGLDCDHIIQGHTEEELFRNGEEHFFNRHGIKREEFTPQFNENLRPLIKHA